VILDSRSQLTTASPTELSVILRDFTFVVKRDRIERLFDDPCNGISQHAAVEMSLDDIVVAPSRTAFLALASGGRFAQDQDRYSCRPIGAPEQSRSARRHRAARYRSGLRQAYFLFYGDAQGHRDNSTAIQPYSRRG